MSPTVAPSQTPPDVRNPGISAQYIYGLIVAVVIAVALIGFIALRKKDYLADNGERFSFWLFSIT